MKKCTCLFAVAMLLVSLVSLVYAVDVPPVDTSEIDVESPVGGSVAISEEPSVTPSEEDLTPAGVVGRSDTFSLSDRFVSVSDLSGLTVNVSDDSIASIADAVNGSNTVSLTNKDGQSFSVPTDALPALDYKYVVFCGSLSGFNEWMGSDKPFVVDSDGWWCSPGTTSGRCFQFSGSRFLGEKTVSSNRINGFQEKKVNYANHSIALKGDGSLYYSSDVPESFTISFVTGFDDLVLSDKFSAGFVAPVLEYDNYNFDGWYLDSGFTTPYVTDYVFIADTTLYAKWTPYRTVTFDTGIDDYVVDSVSVLDGTAYSVPAFAYKGYDFAGAYTDSKYEHIFVDGTVVDSDITLYLKFEKKLYDVGELLSEQVELSKGLQIIQSQLWVVLLVALFYFVYKFFRIFF